MTITPRQAHSQLDAAGNLLHSIALRVAQGVGHCRMLIETGADDSDTLKAEDAGVRGKNWITDPTGETALARLATHERTLDDAEQYMETIRTSIALLVQWCDRWAPTLTQHPRCRVSGPQSVEEWARPDCENLASYSVRNDGTISYRADGLCDRCRMARSRHERSRMTS